MERRIAGPSTGKIASANIPGLRRVESSNDCSMVGRKARAN